MLKFSAVTLKVCGVRGGGSFQFFFQYAEHWNVPLIVNSGGTGDSSGDSALRSRSGVIRSLKVSNVKCCLLGGGSGRCAVQLYMHMHSLDSIALDFY